MKSISNSPDSENNRSSRYYGVPKLREDVIEKLSEAYSKDNLELAEYERRVKLAQDAKTIEELLKIIRDFPQPKSQLSDLTETVSERGKFFITLIGDREVFTDDFKDNKLTIITAIGDATINLSSTEQEKKTYTINNFSLIGDTWLILPPNVNLIRKHFTFIGDYKRKGKREKKQKDKNYTVILKGFKLIGDVVIIEYNQ